jgi:hypothetical protein
MRILTGLLPLMFTTRQKQECTPKATLQDLPVIDFGCKQALRLRGSRFAILFSGLLD